MIIRAIEFVIFYACMIVTGTIFWIFMYVLNRTTVIGRENVKEKKNCLIVCNHLTMIDSWYVIMATHWPWALVFPHLLPWHLPEEGNFMKKNWFLTALCDISRCIPINRGSGDFLKKMDTHLVPRLKRGGIMIYPEGGRSRHPKSGEIKRWKKGAALLAYNAQSHILPVAIRGIEDILPIGAKVPRIFKRVVVVIGKPIEVSELINGDRAKSIKAISLAAREATQELLTQASDMLKQ